MHIYDFLNQVLGGISVLPQTIASATTVNGTGVDCLNTEGQVFGLVLTGNVAGADTTVDVKLQESDDNSTFTDMKDAFGNVAKITQLAGATAGDNQFLPINGIRTKRYVRGSATTTGSSVSAPIAVAVLSRKDITGTGTGTKT